MIGRVNLTFLTEHSDESVLFLVKIQNNVKDSAFSQLVWRNFMWYWLEILLIFLKFSWPWVHDKKSFFFLTYFAGVSTFFGRIYYYPKKWFYFVHVTWAVFTYYPQENLIIGWLKCLQYKIDDIWHHLISDDVTIFHCFVIFYLLSQLFLSFTFVSLNFWRFCFPNKRIFFFWLNLNINCYIIM